MGQVDPTAWALCITFPMLAIFSTIARCYCRRIKKVSLAWNDWLSFAALIFAIANSVNVLYGAVEANLGQHTSLDAAGRPLLGPKVDALEKMTYASEPIVTVAIGLARWSVLMFYAKLFITPSFKVGVYAMYTLNGVWMLGFTLAFLMSCIPVDHFWTQSGGTRTGCMGMDVNLYFALSSVLLDVFVLTMPWPRVSRLQMPLKRKIAVLGILMLGLIIVAIGIGKCYAFFTIEETLLSNHDITYDEAPLFYWTVPECCLSVVCANLPVLNPIFQSMSPENIIGTLRRPFSIQSSSRDVQRAKSQMFDNQAEYAMRFFSPHNNMATLPRAMMARTKVSGGRNPYKPGNFYNNDGSIQIKRIFGTEQV